MQINGHEVSERFWLEAVVTSIGEGKTGTKYINFAHPLIPATATAKLLNDVDASPYVGHSARIALRLVDPQFKKSKFDRRYVCDGLAQVVPF